MHPVLRLYSDVLSSAENVEFRLAPLPRFIYVVHGSATIGGKALGAGEAWQGSGDVTVKPGPEGVTCWRWELARGDQGSTVACAPGMITHEKLTAYLETLPKGELLMRGDSVGFPPRRLRLSALPPGPGHPLPDRGRLACRHTWPRHILWAGRRLVRGGSRSGVRAGGATDRRASSA